MKKILKYMMATAVSFIACFPIVKFQLLTNLSDFLVLMSYLRGMKNCSYSEFLFRNRKTIVSSLKLLDYYWKDLDYSWSHRFLTEAGELDESNIASLVDKVCFFFILQREATPLQASS